MAKDKVLTYGRLYAKLRELGFEENQAEVRGQRVQVFEHPQVAASMIVLPEHTPTDPVEPLHMGLVLGILRSRGILPETNPLLT